MRSEQQVEQIVRGNAEAQEAQSPEELDDARAWDQARADFEELYPEVVADRELWDRVCAIDNELRAAGDQRPYLQRWSAAVERAREGCAYTPQDQRYEQAAHALLEGSDEQALAVVRLLRRHHVAADPHTAPDLSPELSDAQYNEQVIGVMGALRGPTRAAMAQISQMRRQLEGKE